MTETKKQVSTENTHQIITENPEFKKFEKNPVSFFSMEYALDQKLPIYAGGLGVLSGDFVYEAGAQGLPFMALGLFYKKGFLSYEPNQEQGHDNPVIDPTESGFSVLKNQNGERVLLSTEIQERRVYAQIWVKKINTAEVYLLDTDVEENLPEDRKICEHLYPPKFEKKLLQEVILGVLGVKLLRYFAIKPSVYHLNEGHTSFVAMALAIEYMHDHPDETSLMSAFEKIKKKVVATKHTILSGAGLFFKRSDFEGILDRYLDRHGVSYDDFCSIGIKPTSPEIFSTTRFVLKSSRRANAVSMLHTIYEKREHPSSNLIPITNGVFRDRWIDSKFLKEGYSKLSDEELWQAHENSRVEFLKYIEGKTGVQLNPKAMTVTWARRFAAYKRPGIIFSDPEKLEEIVNNDRQPVNFVLAGEASVSDEEGISLIKQIEKFTRDPRFYGKIVYLPDYSLESAKKMVVGSDLWLNTPRRGREASGTSGMKAGLNGVLQCTVLDGWLEEVKWDDKGWVLAEKLTEVELYQVLQNQVIPEFYNRDESGIPTDWIKKMRNTMNMVERQYTTKRMLQEYLNKLYFPSTDYNYKLH